MKMSESNFVPPPPVRKVLTFTLSVSYPALARLFPSLFSVKMKTKFKLLYLVSLPLFAFSLKGYYPFSSVTRNSNPIMMEKHSSAESG